MKTAKIFIVELGGDLSKVKGTVEVIDLYSTLFSEVIYRVGDRERCGE